VRGTHVEENLRRTMEGREVTRWENFYAPYARWFKVQAYPSAEGLSVFFSDVTEEHHIREQLELEQILREKRIEALSHMAGGLAHEISNPLAIIHAKASDLKIAAGEEALLPAMQVMETCTSIVNVSERAMGILRGLRGFARDAANDPMDWASVEQIVEQCVETQEARYERHGVALRVKLAPKLPLLLCREIQIGQIVTNLLNNAFDAIEQGGCEQRWVEVLVAAHGSQVHLEVTDSGPGVEEQFKAHLMEPFFTTKKGGQGMGVGLSLSRAIAQDHGGTLTLVNGAKHTCFQLVLPVAEGDAEHGERVKEGVRHAA
jgi:C4-dicarboxylate-specific signal transduction histidine kinase